MVYIAPTLIDGQPTPAAMWQEALDTLEALSVLGSSPPVQVKDSAFGFGTTTSTTYTSALTSLASLSTTFTVPPSGKVYINIAAAVINGAASGPWDFFASFQITGAATYGPNDTDAIHTRNGSANFGGVSSRRVLVTGLTPGTSPTVTMVYRASSGTGSYGIRSILVEPAQ